MPGVVERQAVRDTLSITDESINNGMRALRLLNTEKPDHTGKLGHLAMRSV